MGYDSVDLEYLNQNKIPLAITGKSNAVSVAEHVITMFLVSARKIIECHELPFGLVVNRSRVAFGLAADREYLA